MAYKSLKHKDIGLYNIRDLLSAFFEKKIEKCFIRSSDSSW